jgi:ABC-type glycerol-3-phosphate transport system substrate-binding protein/AraC-like DNA-binding protein
MAKKTSPQKAPSKALPLSSPVPRERFGLPGLDDLIGGGVLKGSSLLILGPTGSGKSFAAIQFLLEGLRHRENALYVHFGPSSPLLFQALPFQDKLAPHLKSQRLRLMSAESAEALSALAKGMDGSKSGPGISRAVIEVSRPLADLSDAESAALKKFQGQLQSQGATVLLSHRWVPAGPDELDQLSRLSDAPEGVFLLRFKNLEEQLERTLLILSLKGGSPRRALLELNLDEHGLSLQSSDDKARHKEAMKGGPAMLVSAPYFLNEAEKRGYTRIMEPVLARTHYEGVGHKAQGRLYYDHVLTTLYSRATDFGLFLVYEPIIPYLASQNLLTPLDDLIPYYEDLFVTAGLRKSRLGVHQYGLPKHVSTRLLFYRKDLLKKYGFQPPKTWDELETQARHIIAKEKRPGLNGLLFECRAFNQFGYLMEHLWSQKEDLYDRHDGWVFNRGGVRKALGRMSSFFTSGLAPKSALEMGFMLCVNDFLNGNAVFLHHWSDLLRLIHERGEDALDMFGWTLVPVEKAGNEPHAMVGGPSWVIPRNTRYPEMAQAMLKRIMTLELQRELEQKSGWPFPGMRELYLDARTLKRKPYYAEAEHLLRHGKLLEELPYMSGNAQAWMDLGSQELSAVLRKRPAEADFSQTLDSLESRLFSLLPKAAYSPLVGRAVDCMQRRLSSHLSIDQVARELGITRTHLIRCFHQDTGVTPLKFLTDMRIEQAKELFQNTQLNVSEVSQRLGFKNTHHFSKVFRKVAQRSPSDFRKANNAAL